MEIRYPFKQTNEKLVEKILDDDAVMINHMILNKGDSLPEHYSNSNVYMIVVRGTVTLQLEDNIAKKYENGSIVNIPYNVKMHVSNSDAEQLEFFVVKAPSPRLYPA
ncbi:MAG: cupin domain-containing protein [Synergistaceae bacterium]|jgi:quercetin dioxygenase-like cupin family protein|nr:cupin domain-containing protein [Synergistaceae bacterium]MBP9626054.1 cupin domain-containing protein [Synergistaceae bacterium]MBP9956832.1 cupin domain-containing protein [Synergistaceae bacterium]